MERLDLERLVSPNMFLNKYRILRNNDINLLKGIKLLNIEEDQNKLIFHFSNGADLVIDLHDEAYNGPEALELHIPGQPTLVWN